MFAKLECFSCHEVKGESFPAPTEQGKLGPELSQMAEDVAGAGVEARSPR